MPLEKSTLFDPKLVGDLINKVQGASALAQLSGQTPIPFNGQKEFVFTMDSEVDVVAESGAKSHGGVTVTPKTIVPVKIEYGARVSDEFLYASEEEQLGILQAFNEGFARKVARGIDKMAFHGINPRTGLASAVIGTNNFDSVITTPVEAALGLGDIDEVIEEAIGSVDRVTGMALSPAGRAALAKVTATDGRALFPELAWGNAPKVVNGLAVEVNDTVEDSIAYLGDFANAFKWGFAKQIPLEVIQYGDPDNSGYDLKGYNQVYLRAEAYVGWGILDGAAFISIIGEPNPDPLTLTLTAATTLAGGTKVAVTEETGAANELLIKINGKLPHANDIVADGVDGWADYTESAEIAVHAGDKLVVVEVVAATGAVKKAGSIVVTAAKIKS